MAICGKDCSLTINDGTAFEGHRYSINCNAPEIDVRTFGSGAYGSWLTCAKDGTVDVETYLPVTGLEAGDTATVVCVQGAQTLTANDTKCTNANVNVDSKDVVGYKYSFKLTGDVTGW
uniref:Uncharacterized protein n=1 Tax=viral metagenome TaxID=1070528 RepID=A0A6H1ZWH6_9ZZZZ